MIYLAKFAITITVWVALTGGNAIEKPAEYEVVTPDNGTVVYKVIEK